MINLIYAPPSFIGHFLGYVNYKKPLPGTVFGKRGRKRNGPGIQLRLNMEEMGGLKMVAEAAQM